MKSTRRIPVSAARRGNQRGNSLLEFALFSLFLIPTFMGTVTTGIGLGKAIQTAQIARDAGHMYVRQVDFSLQANKDLIVRLSDGMHMTVSGGNGNVILTQVLMIGDNECAAAGLAGGACANRYYPVITQRILIGNAGIYNSTVGSPPDNLLDAQGKISPNDYLTDISCRASTLSNGGDNPNVGLLTLANSERTYIAEAYFNMPELSFLNDGVPINMYARNYF
jgi:hypothetical protein